MNMATHRVQVPSKPAVVWSGTGYLADDKNLVDDGRRRLRQSAANADHLRLIGKHIVDFLLALREH